MNSSKRKFKVFVRGENFLMNLNDSEERFGFNTTRYVEAINEEEAENLVIDMLREDSTLTVSILNAEDDSPMLYVEEITELDSFEGTGVPGGGFTFYEESE